MDYRPGLDSFLWPCSFAYVLAMFCLPSVYCSVYVMSLFSLRSGLPSVYGSVSVPSSDLWLCSVSDIPAVFCLCSGYILSVFWLRFSATVLSRFRLYLHLYDISNNDDDGEDGSRMSYGSYGSRLSYV